jgi:hypothetical protein
VIQIPLTKGMHAVIDAADEALVSPYKWSAFLNGKRYEAMSYVWDASAGRSRKIRMHRLLASCPAGKVVDHRNGNRLDNRRCNLRVCTVAENSRNRMKPRGGTSTFKGVHRSDRTRKPWCSRIWSNGRTIDLGRYETEEAAARAYDGAALTYFGEFARLNFPLQVQ